METYAILVTFLLTAGNFAHCQDWENLLFIKMEEVLQKQEAALNQLQKQEAALSQLKDMQEKQGRIEDKLQDMQEKQGRIEDKLQEMQEKLEHVENNLQEIHQEAKDCLGREDLESFKNISSAGQQELESSLLQEISGVISLLETGGIDECSEGSYNCSDHEACTDKLFKYGCSCVPGFARNGSRCEDMDECAQGKAECSPHAACRNSVGSYSCSCNPPFEGDGRTCEFSCESPAKVIEGLGCVKLVKERKTWQDMNATCLQAGWRLLQHLTVSSLREVIQDFDYYGWIGVYEGKWLESGIPLQEELWSKDYRADPSRPCGFIGWDYSSFLYKVAQYDCSDKDLGLCQFLFQNHQKKST